MSRKIGEGHGDAWIRSGFKELGQILPAFPANGVQPVEEPGLYGNPTQYQVTMSQTDRVEDIIANRQASREADIVEKQQAERIEGNMYFVPGAELRPNSATGNTEYVIPIRDDLEAAFKKVVPDGGPAAEYANEPDREYESMLDRAASMHREQEMEMGMEMELD